MFSQRIIVTAILTPLALILIYFGGLPYQAVIILLLLQAAREYLQLLKQVDLQPALIPVLVGVLLLAGGRALFSFSYSSAILTALLFGLAAWHVIQYERGKSSPAADFGASISVLVYIGFLGGYLLSLRALPNGRWWTLLVLPTVWIADSAAYLVGTAWGRTWLAPRTSPKKTWEGYLAGVIFGTLGALGLYALYTGPLDKNLGGTFLEAALVGLAVSLLIPLGDLTGSMIKRQAGQKHTSDLLPGHGGIFDRLDSLFWAAPIGYYLILHFILQ